MLTFGDIRSEVLGWLDESATSTTSASYLNVTAAIKHAHVMRLTEDAWKFMLWPSTSTLTTVANKQIYSLHQEFLRPLYVRNTTRGVWMVETPARQLEPDGITIETDTDTDRFGIWGASPVASQPTSASVVTIVSSSASDTGSTLAITVTGDTVTGGVQSESITPTGTTPALGLISFTTILSISKAAAWTGTMTATTNSAAVTVLALLPTEYGRSYPQLQLFYLPTAGETITYRFYRRPREISAAKDITDIPSPFERILVYDALLLMGAYDNRLDGGRAGLWKSLRDDLDFQMRQTFLEGQSLGASGRFIREHLSNGVVMQVPD